MLLLGHSVITRQFGQLNLPSPCFRSQPLWQDLQNVCWHFSIDISVFSARCSHWIVPGTQGILAPFWYRLARSFPEPWLWTGWKTHVTALSALEPRTPRSACYLMRHEVREKTNCETPAAIVFEFTLLLSKRKQSKIRATILSILWGTIKTENMEVLVDF